MADEIIAGRYRLEQRLGAGGMSEVWSALDLDLDRQVAVKLLGPHADRTRFEREARAVAALAHPNVCALYGYGEAGGRPFMLLEYLPGGSLEERLTAGRPLPDDETRRIAADIAAGLAHAHERGVVHRDLKPSNVLFDSDGHAKIADFGIARLGETSGMTEVGTVLGTATYISPEQAAGSPATPASDVYSFGVILYRMLAGRLPFESENAIALTVMHRDHAPPPLSELRPDAPARLESLATAALAKSPADRPRDGRALLAELQATGPPVGDTMATQIVRPERGRRRRTGWVVLAGAVLAAAGVILAMVVTFRDGSTAPPASTSLPTTQTAPTTTAPTTSAAEPTTAPETTTTEPATTTEPVTTEPPVATIIPTTEPATTTLPVTTVPLPPPPPPPPTTTPLPTTDTTPTDTVATTADTTTAPAPTLPG